MVADVFFAAEVFFAPPLEAEPLPAIDLVAVDFFAPDFVPVAPFFDAELLLPDDDLVPVDLVDDLVAPDFLAAPDFDPLVLVAISYLFSLIFVCAM